MKSRSFCVSFVRLWCGVLLVPVALIAAPSSEAQTLAPVPAAPPKPATAPAISVLIIALDELGGTSLSTVPLTSVPLTAVPIEPVPPAIVPAPATVAPMSFEGGRPFWRAFADKKPDPYAPLFLPIPEPRTNTDPNQAFPGRQPTGPANGTLNGGNLGPNNLSPLVPARPVAPAGRAQQAAVPLRAALTNLGYADVQTSAPDGNAIVRVLGEKRLPVSTMQALREGLRSLSEAPLAAETERSALIQEATARTANAASALGQATGYRAVIALYVKPFTNGNSSYAVVLCDSARETGEPFLWQESGADEAAARATGATSGAALLDKSIRNWPPTLPSDARALADVHLERARAAAAKNDINLAQEEVIRSTTLDSRRGDGFVFLGDLLAPTDIAASAAAYRRALEINQKDGDTLAKIAIAYANAMIPDFPRALDAGNKAIAAGADSALLRVAMATAQFGRARLFRNPEYNQRYENRAEDAETEARTHLDRALELSPNDSTALRLLASSLFRAGRVFDAVEAYDRFAPTLPKDAALQEDYYEALVAGGGRQEDAFVAFSRATKARGQSIGGLSFDQYSAVAEGFDMRLFNMGKSANQLTSGVATGSIGRESAFLQLTRLKADMSDAEDAINSLRAPAAISPEAASSRVFAATLMMQALENHQTYLDTGQEIYRTRAGELYRQAVGRLNAARVAR